MWIDIKDRLYNTDNIELIAKKDKLSILFHLRSGKKETFSWESEEERDNCFKILYTELLYPDE